MNRCNMKKHDTIHNRQQRTYFTFKLKRNLFSLILTGIGDENLLNCDACNKHLKGICGPAIERLQQGESFKRTRCKDQSILGIWEIYFSRWRIHGVLLLPEIDQSTYHNLFDVLKQFQNEVNDIRSERLARSANPLALLAAAQPYSDNYYQAPKPQRSNAPSYMQSSSTRPSASTRHKGKEIAKPLRPQSESVSLRRQAVQTYQQTTFELLQNSRNKTEDIHSQAEQGVPLQAEQADWLEDTDEEIDEQELEAHYSYMAKIQEVSPEESSSTSQPLEQVQNHDENDVFANVRRHSEQPESINDTYVLEKDDSNVIPDSSNICTNDNQVDQNAAECVDERAALANLIANLTLDTEENKTVLKQLKKANASLTQELEECKTNLDETSRALGEATSSRDSCLIALQTKQTELEKYTTLNDLTSPSVRQNYTVQHCFGHELKKEMNDDLESTDEKQPSLQRQCFKCIVERNENSIMKYIFESHKCQDKNQGDKWLKKLILVTKGKSVETQFDKPSVVRQPNAQRIPKPSVLGKPTPFSNSPEMRCFQTKQSVNKTNVSDGLIKQVTQQNLPLNRNQEVRNTNVLKPGMFRIASTTTQTRTPQLPHASRNTNPHMSKSSGVIHTTSVSRPQLKCYQVKEKVVPNISQVKFTKKEVEDHHRISSISKKTKSVTACNDSSNSRTSNVNADCAELPISASKPKRKANKSVATPHKKTVASDTTIQKSKSYYKELYENTNQEWKWWIAKRCPNSKAKRSSFKSKAVPSSKGRLNLLHMDLCGPMRVASINGKKYILLHAYFKEEGIEHQTSTPRTPEQNGVVERRNRTLVEAARTMLSASKLPLSFWAEAVATACYLSEQINQTDGENLDKMKEKGDPCVMVGYSTQSKGYRVYNKRTRLIVESIHIKFDEIKEMMSDHNSSDLAPQRQEMSVENVSSGLVPQGQKASDYDNSDPVPPRQNVVPTAEKTDSSQQGLEFLFSPLLEEYYNPTHGLAEENNNDQAPNASVSQEAKFINPFCTRVQETGESSSRNIDNTNVHSFQPQSHDYRDRRSSIRTNFVEIQHAQFKQTTSCHRFLKCYFSAHIEELTSSVRQTKRLGTHRQTIWQDGYKLKGYGRNNKIHQSPKGIFINQAKYALEILKKHNMDNCHSIGTPLATKPKLDVDLSGEPVDQSDYRSKIGSLMYLTSSRPDLVQASLVDKLVRWMSKKQELTALSMSSAEADTVALSASLC
ncbi:retrovirus-related pol polyprotein from transposon TNT 1-94 [Tanacetum coccineum]